MSKDAQHDPFFIVGSARSGTTLLRLILNAHPEVAVPPESRFVVELWRGTETVSTTSFLAELGAHQRFHGWGLPIENVGGEIGTQDTVSYADAVEATYLAYARSRGKSRWGDKTPRYIEHIPLLARLFPDARFVHLVRDGRNVALSYSDVPFGPKTVPQAARLWAKRVSAGVRHGRPLGPGRYVELRYEKLVADSEATTRELCDFLRLDYDPGMLDYTERTKDAALPRARRYNPHVTEPPTKDVRSWETDMAPRHIEIFEAVAGGVLTELGYKRRYPAPALRARAVGALGKLGLPLAPLRTPGAR